ncbi:winged helix-turn-helix transcriptional regulator [Roseibium sp. M-1]
MSETFKGPWRLAGTDDCPVADTLKSIGGKHTPRILHCLTVQDHHFLELQRTLPAISRKVLTGELRHLEEIGLVCRTELDDARRRVRYSLTPKGRGLADILRQMFIWALEHRGEETSSAA